MIHFIVNPMGASGNTYAVWQKTEAYLQKKGTEYKVHFSTPETGTEDICRQLTSGIPADGEDVTLVVVGGDGSLNEAVNGIADFEHTRVGLIPAGSGNDLVRDMYLPEGDELVERLVENTVRRTYDVGEIIIHHVCGIDDRVGSDPAGRKDTGSREADGPVRRLFNVSAGMGFDAAICVGVEHSGGKKLLNRIGLGKLIYLLVAIRMIFSMKPAAIRIEGALKKAKDNGAGAFGETEVFTAEKPLVFDRAMFAAAMNHQFEGGGFRFAPVSSACDGLLDIVVPDGLSTLDFFRLFPKASGGRHVGSRGINILRSDRIRIHSQSPLWVHTDGEAWYASDDLTIGISGSRLKMLV